MVNVKVSDGSETRRLRLTGEVTFSQLQEKLATLFPHSVHKDKPLTLLYRDSDGDLITLSSEEEFQGILSTVNSDAVLKLYIKKTAQPAQPRSHHCHRHRVRGGASIFDLLDSDLWGSFDKQFKQTESLLRQLWGVTQQDDSSKETKDESREEHTAQEHESETTKLEQDDESKQDGETELAEEPVKSKTQTEETKSDTQSPVIRCKSVLSFAPRVQYTWFGPRTVFTPVQYNIVYWDQEESGDREQAKEKSGEQATVSTDHSASQEATVTVN